jgi:hypothetical protein
VAVDTCHAAGTVPKVEVLMKRSPLKRSTPLTAKKRLTSKSRKIPDSVRAQVMARDMGCVAQFMIREVICSGHLDAHHVLMRSQGGPDTAENLKVLCRAHHEWVHRHPAKSYALDLLRRGGNLSEKSAR